jgi:hypothetical protein
MKEGLNSTFDRVSLIRILGGLHVICGLIARSKFHVESESMSVSGERQILGEGYNIASLMGAGMRDGLAGIISTI